MIKNKMQFIFKLEAVLAFIIIGGAFLLKSSSLMTPRKEIIIAGILCLSALLLQERVPNRFVLVTNNFLRLILVALFPFTVMTAISILANPFIGTHSFQKWLVLIISFVVFIGAIIPYIQKVLRPTAGITMRILTSYVLISSFTFIAITSKTFGFPFSYTVSLVPFAIILIFGILMYVMKLWGYRLPRWGVNSKVNYWWLFLAIITALLNWGLTAGSWSRLFGHFDLAVAQTAIVGIVLTIVWTGLKEEFMFRYLTLWPLLMMKIKSDKTRVLVAILISSTIFGLYHASNVGHQSVLETCLQIFAAFGVGMVFSVITLYTGNIWIVVALHSMIDLIGYPITNSGPFSGSVSAYEIEFIIITRIIELVVVFLMLGNHRVQAGIKQTLANIRAN